MTEISKEYAEALFALACEMDEQEAVMRALETVMKDMEEQDGLMALLSSPAIPLTERVAVIERCYATCLPETVVSFLQLLCEKGRIGLVGACVKEYRRLLDVSRSVKAVKVTSAVPLTLAEQAALTAKLERASGCTVQLLCTVDPSLLGGMIVEMDGRVTDGSLRHRLQEVKEVITREHKA